MLFLSRDVEMEFRAVFSPDWVVDTKVDGDVCLVGVSFSATIETGPDCH
jgi:hypothetical protein